MFKYFNGICIVCKKHGKLQIPSVVLHYKIMNFYNKVFIIFSWCNSATKRFWVTFVWYCWIHYIWKCLLARFLSQLDWISENATIIAVMGKDTGVYLLLQSQVYFFDASKIAFLEKKAIKTESLWEERKPNIKLKSRKQKRFQEWLNKKPIFMDVKHEPNHFKKKN